MSSSSDRQQVRRRVVAGCAAAALVTFASAPVAAAQPIPGTVGTVVHVVVQKSFAPTQDADECVGTGTLATLHRGSSVLLSDGAPASAESPKVAVGQFLRSRLKDDACQFLYITSAPVLPAFNVQFAGPDSALSPTFGPVAATSETDPDIPDIKQSLRVDMGLEAQG